jgi:hypothetical protein
MALDADTLIGTHSADNIMAQEKNPEKMPETWSASVFVSSKIP